MALSPYIVTVITKEDAPYNVVPNAPIEIRARLSNGTSGGLSLIYSDQAGASPITQAGATADSNGQFVFYAEAAEYNAVYQSQTVPVDMGLTPSTLPSALINDLSQAYEFNSFDEFVASYISLPLGKIVNTQEYKTGSGFGAAQYVVTDASTIPAPDAYGNKYIQHGTSKVAVLQLKGTGEARTTTPEKFGMITGDDSINYGPNMIAMMNEANVYECGGLYHVPNIIFPNKIIRFINKRAHVGGFVANDNFPHSTLYFAAPITWINDDAAVNLPVHNDGCIFNGGSTRDMTVVARWYGATWSGVWQALGGITDSLRLTALGILGASPTSTMVNNSFWNGYVQGGGFHVTDDGKTTDWKVIGLICNAPFSAKTMAGSVVRDLHVYNGSATFSKMSGGTVLAGCYFENETLLQEQFGKFIFGPGNTCKLNLTCDFGANATDLILSDNKLNQVIHGYFGDRKLIIDGGIVDGVTPISFSNSGAGNAATMEVLGAMLTDGNRYSGNLSPSTGRTSAAFLSNVSDFPIVDIATDTTDTPVNSYSKDFTFKTPIANSSLLVRFDVAKRGGGTGAIEIAAAAEIAISIYGFGSASTTTMSNVVTGSFTADPAAVYLDNLDGTSTVTVSAAWTNVNVAIGMVAVRIIA